MTQTQEIQAWLLSEQDIKYKEFQQKLIPTVAEELIIGVRTPVLKKYAKELKKSGEDISFLDELPHHYFDENQLHAFLISLEKDFETAVMRTEDFLPYIDNWATCDQLSPKVFKKHLQELLPHIEKWLASEKTYTVRFGIGMLMEHYLDDAFEERFLKWVVGIRSEEYYINMMIAWYFATALAKQYEVVLPYLREGHLDRWVHNKTIQKAVESRRIHEEQKEYLKSLRKRGRCPYA